MKVHLIGSLLWGGLLVLSTSGGSYAASKYAMNAPIKDLTIKVTNLGNPQKTATFATDATGTATIPISFLYPWSKNTSAYNNRVWRIEYTLPVVAERTMSIGPNYVTTQNENKGEKSQGVTISQNGPEVNITLKFKAKPM